MAQVLSQARMRLTSNPYWKRVGLFPMGLTLGLCWLFVLLWIGLSVWIIQYNLIWAMTFLASTCLFSFYLGYTTYKFVLDGYKDYDFELTETEAVLCVFDRLRKKKGTRMVLLDDVKFAEYYPYPDSAAIILHAPYIDLEVPLWPMGAHGQDVVDFLDGHGVPVVNVLLDDKIESRN